MDIVKRAHADRQALQKVKIESGEIGANTMLDVEGNNCDTFTTGEAVLDFEGGKVATDRVLKVYQVRDRHHKNRGDRFIVGRLMSFKPPEKGGHDITTGSCVFVQWDEGSKASGKPYAVCRVVGMIDATPEGSRRIWSMSLEDERDKKVSMQSISLVVELLDPVGAPPEAGPRRYRGSGWQLPKLAHALLLDRVGLALHIQDVLNLE